MKLNDELPGGERQDTRRAQGMVDYAKLCVRVLRNQPGPSELWAPGAYEMTCAASCLCWLDNGADIANTDPQVQSGSTCRH